MSRAMKDSGIAWIGEIPEEWKIGKAKYYISISNGSDPQTEGNIPVYGSGANSFKTCGEFKEGPAVLIGRKGATLHIPHYIKDRYWNVDTAFDVKPISWYNLRYYYYLACSFDYRYYISQTTLPGMTQTNYENMALPVPGTDEQAAIVLFLDHRCAEIDRVIAATQRTIEEYKKLKQSIITEAVTHGVRGPRKMKDSGVEWIGEIPEEWSVTRIRFVGQVKTGPFGTQLSAEEYTDEGIPIVNVKNIGSGFIRTENLDKIPENVAERLKEHKLMPNDIVFARKGSIDKHAIININNSGWVQGSDCIRVRLVSNVSSLYLNYYLESIIIKDYLWTASNGATMASLNSEMIEDIYIVLPTSSEQSSIVEYLDAKCLEIDHLIDAKQQLLAQLESYKKSVIYEYVTGKREVPA